MSIHSAVSIEHRLVTDKCRAVPCTVLNIHVYVAFASRDKNSKIWYTSAPTSRSIRCVFQLGRAERGLAGSSGAL